jgi:hypothetical protein
MEGINKGKEAMSHRTIKTLNKVADLLEAAARGIVNGIELVVLDFSSKKRSRRIRRTYTRRSPSYVRHSVYRQAPQELIIKVVQEKEL